MTYKILIVGHPQCGLKSVQALLQAAGMAPARVSRREGLSPAAINAILLEAHPQHAGGPHAIGPVWHGLALDLLMANLDQPLWGWQDASALPLLDFWCAVDPGLRVVLAYDHPDSVLTRLGAAEAFDLTLASCDQRLREWSTYQEVALRFAYRHRDRCLLVQAHQAAQAPQALLDAVSRIAPADWRLPAGWHAPEPGADVALTRWLARTPVEASPHAMAMYDEWQAVADLPAEAAPTSLAPPTSVPLSAAEWLPAWRAWADCRLQMARRDDELARRANALAALEQQALVAEQAHRSERLDLQTRLQVSLAEADARHQRQAETAQARLQELQDESAALLNQLHRVQETCEALHLTQQREVDAHKLAIAQAQESGRRAQAESLALRAERDTLQARVKAGEAQIAVLRQDAARELHERQSHASREAAQRAELESVIRRSEQENALLLSQLHRVQESLERVHQERTAKPATPRPPVPYGAANRVKQQLSYRLGAKMIEQSGSLGGWVAMPWALKQVHADYRHDLAQRGDRKLPPLHTYGDAPEGERVKQHLSYRLGQTLIKHGQSPVGWLTLPVALGREVQAFRRSREQVPA